MNFRDPREPWFRGLLFFRESRKSKRNPRSAEGIGFREEFADSALNNLDRKRMERYSVSQVAKRIQSVAEGIGRGFSTKGGSVEELNQTGCNQSVELTALADARAAAHL